MINESVIQLAQLSTIVVGFMGVAVTLRSHRRQMHAQMFIEFSSRFHDVLHNLPAATWAANQIVDGPVPPRSDELTKASLQCFHIIASLYHLHRGGYVSKELWNPWQRGIRRALQGPVLSREWHAVESAFDHQPDLCRYIRRMIHDPEHKPRRRWLRPVPVLVSSR